jgi:mannitol/fructose-specific phosphotransferase system IIA component (Ntr-type)
MMVLHLVLVTTDLAVEFVHQLVDRGIQVFVGLLIFLLVPEAATQRHLEILSEIAAMPSDRELRERLKTESDAATVHQLIANWEPLKSVA